MPDDFARIPRTLESPATRFEVATPSDTATLNRPSRALYIGGAGRVVVEDMDGNEAIFAGATAGSVLPIRVRRVRNSATTGGSPTLFTTATDILSLS